MFNRPTFGVHFSSLGDWLNTTTGSTLGDWLNPKGVPVPANDLQRSEALTTITSPRPFRGEDG